MDGRWAPPNRDRFLDYKVILHPTAGINTVRTGQYANESPPMEDDSVDLTDFLANGTQSAFECTVTLNWRLELFGAAQPYAGQVLEIQAYDSSSANYLAIWLGIIDSVSSYTMERGERSMQLIARSRDSQPAWKTTKRITPLYPQLTDMAYIARAVAMNVGMTAEEIVFPMSSMLTSHANTQMADMTAWEMIEAVLLPMGWAPFVDSLGRLRTSDRTLQGRQPDIVLEDEATVKAAGSSMRPQTSRLRVVWLNPVLKKSLQQQRLIQTVNLTFGWYLPYWKHTVYFSDDKTQRAQNTRMWKIQSVNQFIPYFALESYTQTGENKGRIEVINVSFAALIALILLWHSAHHEPDLTTTVGGPTVPVGRTHEGYYQLAVMLIMMNVGNGIYEIWGEPYEWVHAKNTTEVFNDSMDKELDNPIDIETDFILNEDHAQAVAIRELIFKTREASQWTAEINDDYRIEYGDVMQFPDESKMYITDFSRNLTRGGDTDMRVSGFLF